MAGGSAPKVGKVELTVAKAAKVELDKFGTLVSRVGEFDDNRTLATEMGPHP